jgi:small-conductance mechanosensitive channel
MISAKHGRCCRETDVETTDLETVITDLIEGQYKNPVRVVGFNTAEGWSCDVSEDIADEIRDRCDRQGIDIPAHFQSFVESHENRDRRQLTLSLV